MMRPKSTLLARLNQDSLLAILPGFSELCLEHGRVVRLHRGDAACRQGERLQNLIIPIIGSLKMSRHNDRRDQEVGVLQELRSLGLREILYDEPVSFDATAEGDCQVLSIPTVTFLAHVRGLPHIENYLKLMVSSSAVRAFRDFLVDQRLKPRDIFEVFSALDTAPVNLDANSVLDMDVPSLWFVSKGALQTKPPQKTRSSGRALREGDFFGAEALTAPYRHEYQTLAVESSILHRADLSKLRPILKRMGLIDALIVSDRSRFDRTMSRKIGPWDPVNLPGRALSEVEFSSLGLQVGRESLRFGNQARNSKFDSVYNFLILLNHPTQPASVRLDMRLNGMTYATLAQALERFGFLCRSATCSIGQLHRQPLPALVGYGPRWSVLLKTSSEGFWLVDPVQGPIVVRSAEFARHWNGEIFLAESAAADWIADSESKPFKVIFSVFAKAKSGLISLFGVRILMLALGALSPLLAGHVVGRLSQGAEFDEVAGLTLAGLVLFTSAVILSFAGRMMVIELGQRFDFSLRRIFLRMVMRLRSNHRLTLGEMSTYEVEFAELAQFLLHVVTNSTFDLAAILLYSALLATYHVGFPFIALGLMLAALTLRLTAAGPLRSLFMRQIDAAARVRQSLSEVIGSMDVVKASGSETISRHALEADFIEGWRARLRTDAVQISLEGAVQLLSVLAIAGSLYLASWLHFRGQFGIGEVMTINVLMVMLLSHLNELVAKVGRLEELRASASKIAEFFALPAETDVSRATSDLNTGLSGHIEFDHVSYSYPGSPRAIYSNLCFSVYPNQTVAIVGRSGAGKSTLARLIAGDLKPTSGRILVDGYDLALLSPECRRREISIVLQKNELLAGTVAENVAYAADRPKAKRIRSALKLASADGFVNQLHRGADNYLGEGGLGLSGGERQRIAIARSIYASPAIYVFDEATSALDADSESEVVANMKKFLAGRTAIIIAHRLSTIRAADRILVVNDGELVEDGTHDELIRRNGLYSELFGDQYDLAQGRN